MDIFVLRGDLSTSSQQLLWSDYSVMDPPEGGPYTLMSKGLLPAETDFYIVNDRIEAGNQKQRQCAGKG